MATKITSFTNILGQSTTLVDWSDWKDETPWSSDDDDTDDDDDIITSVHAMAIHVPCVVKRRVTFSSSVEYISYNDDWLDDYQQARYNQYKYDKCRFMDRIYEMEELFAQCLKNRKKEYHE